MYIFLINTAKVCFVQFLFLYLQQINNKNMKNMEVTVTKTDILNIGHTAFNENGNTAIVCKVDCSGIEEILLRSILKCYGEEYAIIDEYDSWDEDENDEIVKGTEDIVFVTNLPYEMFLEIR